MPLLRPARPSAGRSDAAGPPTTVDWAEIRPPGPDSNRAPIPRHRARSALRSPPRRPCSQRTVHGVRLREVRSRSGPVRAASGRAAARRAWRAVRAPVRRPRWRRHGSLRHPPPPERTRRTVGVHAVGGTPDRGQAIWSREDIPVPVMPSVSSCMSLSRWTTKWTAPAMRRLAASKGRRSGAWTAYEAMRRKTPAEESAWMVHMDPDRPWLMALSIGSTSSPSTSPTITRSAFMRRARRTRSATEMRP